MDGVGGCGCRLVGGRRGKAQGRELGRGQGNFKLAANFGYSSRGSADPRESLRRCWISKLALTAHKVLHERSIRNLQLFVRKREDIWENSFISRNCSVPSQLRAKMHLKSPSVMAFWLVCLGILAYSCQNTSRYSGY